MEIEGQFAILTADEQRATGLTSPANLAELTDERLYAEFNARFAEFNNRRALDDDELVHAERDSALDVARQLTLDRQLIKQMADTLITHGFEILTPEDFLNS